MGEHVFANGVLKRQPYNFTTELFVQRLDLERPRLRASARDIRHQEFSVNRAIVTLWPSYLLP